MGKTIRILLGASMFAVGFAIIYGGFDAPAANGALQFRDYAFSLGIALMGAGLYLLVRVFVYPRR